MTTTNAAIKSENTGLIINEQLTDYRKSRLEQIANQNYNQSKAMHGARENGLKVSAQLLLVARGVFLQIAPIDFDSLDKSERLKIGENVYTEFELELEEAESDFMMRSPSLDVKKYRTFEGGNWKNVKSKVKKALGYGYNIATIDENNTFVDTDLQSVVTSSNEAEEAELEAKKAERRQEKENAAVLTAKGRLDHAKSMLIDRFNQTIDGLGEGLSDEKALKSVIALSVQLENSFWPKVGKIIVANGLMSQEGTSAIKARMDKKQSDFIAKARSLKQEVEVIPTLEVEELEETGLM